MFSATKSMADQGRGQLSFHCGREAWQVLSVLRLRRLLCLFRLAPSCAVLRRLAASCGVLRRLAASCGVLRRLAASCGVLCRLAICALLRDGADGERSETTIYTTAMFHSNQPETNPLSAGVSRPYLPPATNKATEFSFSAKCSHQRQQQQEAAAAGGGSSSSSRRKQQQQQEEAAAGSSISRRRQQQQQQEAAAGGSSSRSTSSSSSSSSSTSSSNNSRRQQGGSSTSSSSGSSSKMQPISGNQRPHLLTSLMNMSLALRLPRKMHLCRSPSNVPRLPSFLEMLQNPKVLLTFDKVHNPLRLPRKTTSEPSKVVRT